MDLGVYLFTTDETLDPRELARMTEDLGFESLWFPEHTHIPTSRETPYPGGGPLPREYSRTYDLFVALTAAAVVTERIRLGSGICLVTERDPIVTANAIASVDHISGGRLEFGVGPGWNHEEMLNHGTDPSTRFALMADRLQAMRAIWTSDEASYDGPFVQFDSIWSWPKPVQTPHPPVVIAGSGPTVLDRVLEHGDGWLPISGRGPDLAGRIAELQSRAAKAGRAHIPVSLYNAYPTPQAVDAAAEAGVDRCIFRLPTSAPDEVRATLVQYAQLLAR
ncbi:MAG: LLM class F420-dependent oxidoreductase [Actinomycetota bacterium]